MMLIIPPGEVESSRKPLVPLTSVPQKQCQTGRHNSLLLPGRAPLMPQNHWSNSGFGPARAGHEVALAGQHCAPDTVPQGAAHAGLLGRAASSSPQNCSR